MVKITGLAVIAALVLAAFLGASSAMGSPTVLCKASPQYGYCPEAERYPSGTWLEASAKGLKILLYPKSSEYIECAEFTIAGKTTETSGEPLSGKEAAEWMLSECERNGAECAASAVNLTYSLSIAHTTGANGTFSLKGSGGEAGWNFECEGLLTCTYSFNPTLTITGGNPAQLSLAEQELKQSGTFCVSEHPRVMATTMTVTAPRPMYVATTKEEEKAYGTVLCAVNESPCMENAYPAGTEFSAKLASGTHLEIQTGSSKFVCEKSSFSGETTKIGGEPSLPATITSFSVSECEHPILGSCSPIATGLPYSTSFEYREEGKGKKTMWVSNPQLYFNCSGFNCTYKPGKLEFSMTSGQPAKLEVWQSIPGYGTCPATPVTLKAKYEVTSPSALYLAYN